MRLRWLALSLIAVFALTTVGPAHAQIPMLAQGMVMSTVASVNAANTTAETLLFQYPIPAALLASWTSTNAFGSAPLHLRLNGTIVTSGASPGATLGVNLTSASGVVASMVIINGAALQQDLGRGLVCGGSSAGLTGACPAPASIDVYLSPIATLTTQNCTDLRPCNQSIYMAGDAKFASLSSTSVATISTYNTASLAAANINQALTLNVVWRWAVAASVNSVNIYNGVLKLGH